MAFKKVQDLGCDKAISIGGLNKKTGKKNPTQLEGYFLGSRDIDNKLSATGKAKLHVFQTQNGTVGVFGKTDLDIKMATVTPGVMTRVTANGEVPTNKGNPMKKYLVETDEEQTIEVSEPTPSNEEAPEEAGGAEEEYAEDDDALDEDDDVPVDEPPAKRASPPKTPAAAPNAAHQDKVRALLNKPRGRAAS